MQGGGSSLTGRRNWRAQSPKGRPVNRGRRPPAGSGPGNVVHGYGPVPQRRIRGRRHRDGIAVERPVVEEVRDRRAVGADAGVLGRPQHAARGGHDAGDLAVGDPAAAAACPRASPPARHRRCRRDRSPTQSTTEGRLSMAGWDRASRRSSACGDRARGAGQLATDGCQNLKQRRGGLHAEIAQEPLLLEARPVLDRAPTGDRSLRDADRRGQPRLRKAVPHRGSA